MNQGVIKASRNRWYHHRELAAQTPLRYLQTLLTSKKSKQASNTILFLVTFTFLRGSLRATYELRDLLVVRLANSHPQDARAESRLKAGVGAKTILSTSPERSEDSWWPRPGSALTARNTFARQSLSSFR